MSPKTGEACAFLKPSCKTESELLGEFRSAGSRAAFEELAQRHAGFIRRTLYLKLRNRSEADEAFQDVLIALFRSLKNFSGRSSLSTWVYRICGNVAADAIRKKKRDRARLGVMRLFASDTDPREKDMPHWDSERESGAEIILASLDSLGEPDRTILYLRDAEGLSVEEIASAVGIPEGTVKSKLSRSREKFRKNTEIRAFLGLDGDGTEVKNERSHG